MSTENEQPVRLSCITRITSQDYWLTSCGMWQGPTEINPTFTSVKPTCTGRRPDEAGIAEDFTHVLTNIRKLTGLLQLKDKSIRKGLLTDWTTPEPKIKFRHTLFTISWNNLTFHTTKLTWTKLRSHDEDDDENNDANNLGVEFTLEQWPAHFDAGRKAILELELTNTHKLNVIPAYDINGEIIKPKEYRGKLEGALVRTEFHMNYWRVKGKDFFAADIQAMRVLEKPRASGTKHKALSVADPGPSKKMKKG